MRTTFALPLVALLSCGVLITGCGGGTERTQNTVGAASATVAKVDAARIHLDGLTQTLTNFRGATAGADLKGLYKSFLSQHDNVTSAVNAVNASADATEAKGNTQLTEWNKQISTIQDEDLRAASAKRSSDLRMALTNLTTSKSSFATVSSGVLGQLGDIKKALDADLTTAGVTGIKPTLSKVVESMGNLKSSFLDVSAKAKVITDLLASK